MTDATFGGGWASTPSTSTDALVDDDALNSVTTEEVKETPKKATTEKRASTRAAAKRPVARKPARSKGVDRKLVASVIEKTLAVQSIEDEDRTLLASILGTEDDVTELVTSILSGGAKTDSASKAVELSEIDDETERGVSAALLGTDLKSVWSVYHSLGLVSADAPESLSKAAVALSKAASEFSNDRDARARLDTIIEIAQ